MAATYFVAAKLSLHVALVEKSVTPIWPPTGIALVAFLYLGRRTWPGIAVAAFLVNLPISPNPGAALAIAGGNTAAPLLAAYLLGRVAFRGELDRSRDAVALVFLGALISMTVSATVGTSALKASGAIAQKDYLSTWAVWWVGDAMGILIFAPFFFSIIYRGNTGPTVWPRRIETGVVLVLVGLASAFAFRTALPIQYVVFPLLGWTAIRLHQQGAAPAALVASSVAVWAAIKGRGPFDNAGLFEKMITLQVFNGGVALTSFVLAALTAERTRAREALRAAHSELEERVTARTLELRDTNERLEAGIGERERLLDELRTAGTKLAQAQHIAHVGSWEWDVGENRIAWSDELYRMYGVDRGEFDATYESFIGLVHPEDRSVVEEAVGRAFRDGTGFEFHHRIVRPDGRERILHGRGEVEVGDAGAVIRMAGTAQDVTERILAEQAIEAEMRALSAAKTEFVATAAHELRTPLATIKGLAELLERRGQMSDGQLDEIIQRLRRQSDRLSRLVGKLLDVSQIEAGHVDVHIKDVDVSTAVRAALEVAPPPEDTEVRLTLPPLVARADANRLEQVLVNLLTNAYRYGGRAVHVAAEIAGSEVLISVIDDGLGVPPEFVPDLFEKFRRGGNGHHQEASGLGLAIVRGLIEAQGGRIRYEQGSPQGSRFLVSLPTAS